ncbi:MAG: sensor histidine kinase, partial [Gemmatimonadaceae bacterium]
RVATELRDGALQALTGLSLQLASAIRRAGADADHLLAAVAEAETMLADELRVLRMLVLELTEEAEHAPSSASLTSQLAAMIDRVHRVWGLTTALTVGSTPPVIDSSRLALELVHLVQEALVNAARYAEAKGAAVHVSGGEGVVHLRVEQVGRGFAFHGAMEHEELVTSRRGPVALKLRVRALGGRLRIESSDDRATVQMDIPTGVKA